MQEIRLSQRGNNMFDVNHPPLMVMPVTSDQIQLLPESEGFLLHRVAEDEVYACYKTGWTFPIYVETKSSFTGIPLLLVRDKGRVTAEGSAFLKGYAHRFVLDNGQPPNIAPNSRIFPNDKHSNWLLVPGYVNVVWLQYGYRGRTAEGPVAIQEQTDSGKLLILRLEVVKDSAPRLDKKADIPEMHNIQYRVNERQLFYENWSVINQDPMVYLGKLLDEKGLPLFKDAVRKALEVAGCDF
jgi:hypothetical protein